ncbi:MAG: peptidoglycan-binding protein [Bacilli bacterium]|nr:peptidoglycan-binding protein [Bacilli bacterium]MBR6100741.1 peptidoglycan-binding protein [bacterium]
MEIRTVCPNNNKYYITTSKGGWNMAIQGNPTKSGANVLANCVGYANGRFAEIIGKNKIEYQLICNAENFIEKAQKYGLQISSTPTLGGIMVWEGKGSLAGHVAIVERIDNDNQIFTSESAYGGSAFYNKTRTNSNGRWGMGTNYSFRGCIINPSNPTPPAPTPTGDPQIRYIQETLNKHYNTGLYVDGIYGPATNKGLVKALQMELNTQFNAGLVIDGIFGPATKSKCISLRYGAEGWITWTAQCELYCRGYYLKFLDGVYKDATINQVCNFQRNNGLDDDGICGKNTFEKLFK